MENREKNQRLKILLDLELPFLNPYLFIKNISFFSQNKKLLEEIFQMAQEFNIEIFTFESPPIFFFKFFLKPSLGLTFDLKKFPHKKIISCYTSSVPIFLRKPMLKSALKLWQCFGDKIIIALSLLSKGFWYERVISPKGPQKDIEFFTSHDVNNFAIFRLAGLNQEYLKILKPHISYLKAGAIFLLRWLRSKFVSPLNV